MGEGCDPASPSGYEYLDHTADIQYHTWGSNIHEAFTMLPLALFNWITDLDTVQTIDSLDVEVEAESIERLVYSFLDELLFIFDTDFFTVKECVITDLSQSSSGKWSLQAHVQGETFDVTRHPQNSDVKAITYSALQVIQEDDRVDIYCIVDI